MFQVNSAFRDYIKAWYFVQLKCFFNAMPTKREKVMICRKRSKLLVLPQNFLPH